MKISKANHQRIDHKIRVASAALDSAFSTLRGLFMELQAVETLPPSESALEQARLEGWLAAIQAVSETAGFDGHEDARAAIITDLERQCHQYFELHTVVAPEVAR